jgi:RNA polymerase sigma factor (sigma-70 family)
MAETTHLLPLETQGPRPLSSGIDWPALLAQHDRWLRTAVLVRVGENQAVDDVMQEVALAAVAQRAPLNDSARLGSWLYKIAMRQALLHRRRCGRRRKIVDGYAMKQAHLSAGAAASDPLGLLLHDERLKIVRAALGRLPRRDAEILLLKYTEDWSYRELAARLGVGESAVEARLHRARQRLREALVETRE